MKERKKEREKERKKERRNFTAKRYKFIAFCCCG